MRWIGAILIIGLMVAPGSVLGDQTVSNYGWEDNPDPVILGNYLTVTATVVTDEYYEDTHSLELIDGGDTGTAQAYVAWITGLEEGDQVTANFYAMKNTNGGDGVRIWGHYTSNPALIGSYHGSAGGNDSYSGDTWTFLEQVWTFNSDGGAHDGIVVEARTYSVAGDGGWVDTMSITAPDHATIYYPGHFDPPEPNPIAYGKLTVTMKNTAVMVHGGGVDDPKLCLEYEDDVVISAIPSNGTLSDNSGNIAAIDLPHTLSGNLNYTPDTDYSGLDTFWFYGSNAVTNGLPVKQEVAVQESAVAISEVMHSPSSYDSTYEFIEIYNYSASAVQLTRLDSRRDVETNTIDNLTSNGTPFEIPAGAMRIIAIDNTAEYPDSAEEFRCEWGQKYSDSSRVSLYESKILRIPFANWEYMYANPDENCADASGSRILLFGKIAGEDVLLDAVDLTRADADQCYDSSYTIVDTFLMGADLTSENNDDPDINPWRCQGAPDYTDGMLTGLREGDSASPGYVPTRNESPTYDATCLGACCMPDGVCTNGWDVAIFEFECEALCGDPFPGQDYCDSCTADPVGRCCLPTGVCIDVSECLCDLYSEPYTGDWASGSSCTSPGEITGECDAYVQVSMEINELEYDSPGSDDAEFIEMWTTNGAISLESWTLEFFNGAAGSPNLYQTVYLEDAPDGLMPSDGYLVVGSSYVNNVDFTPSGWTIQNGTGGDADGVVLLFNGVPVEALSYGGTNGFTADGGQADGTYMTNIGLTDDGETTLQKISDGGTWTITANNTPGESNYDIAEYGACCNVAAQTCELTLPEDCTSSGFEFLGLGTDCDPNPCIPSGACCRPDGSCVENVYEDTCTDVLDGIWKGEDSYCMDIAEFVDCITGPIDEIPNIQVRVATFNIENFSPSHPAQFAAAVDILERIGADVVCVQEIASYSDLDDLADAAGYPYKELASGTSLDYTLHSGIMSLYPMSARTETAVSLSGDSNANDLTRNFVVAEVSVPDAEYDLVVIGNHWKSGTSDADEFRRSVESIRAMLATDDYDSNTIPYFVVGDMNDDIDDSPDTPAQFNSVPGGMPGSYSLGTDITFPVDNGVFKALEAGTGTQDLTEIDAEQLAGSPIDATRRSSGRRLDYMWNSSAVTVLGSEVYDSEDEGQPGGLTKYGSALPSETSDNASDHLLVFADVSLTQVGCDDWDFDTNGHVDLYDFYRFQQEICLVDVVGACCLPDGSCEEVTEWECDTLYGTNGYQGDGVSCGSVSCTADDSGNILINEIWADDPYTDTNEFIELWSSTAANLENYSLIIVDGDTDGDTSSVNYRKVNFQADFTSSHTFDNDYFTMGNGPEADPPTSDVDLDVTFGDGEGDVDEIENGSQTYALVQTSLIAFCTSSGVPDSYCTDDDDQLTQDSVDAITAAIRTNLADAVATRYGSFDHVYFYAPLVQDSGWYQFAYGQRIPDHQDTNMASDWETVYWVEMGDPDDPSTPDAVNVSQSDVPGACCFTDVCSNGMTETECTGAGGEFQGYGTDCDPNPCVGACCIGTTGVCEELTESGCVATNGVFLGYGTDCDPNPCIGACCVGETCSEVVDELDCAGTFLGFGTDCDPNPCEVNTSGVLINEVLGSTTSTDSEFIELYNSGSQTVDLANWYIELWDSDTGSIPGQDGGSPYVIPAGKSIAPGAYYLMANTTFSTYYTATPDQVIQENGIENSSYTIILKSAAGQTISSAFVVDADAGDYANDNGTPITPDVSIGPDGTYLPAGFFRCPDAAVTVGLLEYTPQPAPSATPGAANGTCP